MKEYAWSVNLGEHIISGKIFFLTVTSGAAETQFVYNSHDFETAIHLMLNHCKMNHQLKAIK